MNVVVVEDDARLSELLDRVLRDEGHVVSRAKSIAEARHRLREVPCDVVILDRMLPDGDGLELCVELRRSGGSSAVLLLTARGEVDDRVIGLRSGADDYLVKPFEVEELLARVETLGRRVRRSATLLVMGGLEIDRLHRSVRVGGVRIDVTAREFALLARLAETPDQPVSRADLHQSVWSLSFDPGSGVLEVHVSRLREKLGDHAFRVETVRGTGYRLRTAR